MIFYLTTIISLLNVTQAKEMFVNTLSKYANAKGLEMHYTISSNNGVAESISYYSKSNNYYYDGPAHASLSNEKYFVYVEKGVKKITITPKAKSKKAEQPQDFQGLIKELDLYSVSVVQKGDVARIKLESSNQLVQNMFYEIDIKKMILKKVEYTYQTNNKRVNVKTEISYAEPEFDKKFEKDFFSEKRILKYTKGKYEIGCEKYKGYRVIDHTQE